MFYDKMSNVRDSLEDRIHINQRLRDAYFKYLELVSKG